MGMIQSVFCSFTFCVERVLTWTCCAFVLMLLMFGMLILIIYGISVGYHYAQKELASFAMSSRTTTPEPVLRGGDEVPVVRLLAVNRSEVDHPPQPIVDAYMPKPAQNKEIFLASTQESVILLETQRPPSQPELSDTERDLARRLIGRYRRSGNNTTPFLRPLAAAPRLPHSLPDRMAAGDFAYVKPSNHSRKHNIITAS